MTQTCHNIYLKSVLIQTTDRALYTQSKKKMLILLGQTAKNKQFY